VSISVTKLTDINLMHRACEATMHGKKSKLTLAKAYQCQHSVIRTQMFFVEMMGIPTFVSVHLVRHSQGVTHFVTSNREDRGGEGEINRMTPVNHSFICNAETLINMARKRLCSQAHIDTQDVMMIIKNKVLRVDPDLARYMVPDCEYRNGCHELKSCGLWKNNMIAPM
jgi:hypothetical protein